MARTLPYVTAEQQPRLQRIGPAEGPQVELPAYGYLLQGETEMVQAVEEQMDLYVATAEVAVAIAQAEDIGPVEAHKIVTRLLSYHLFGHRIELSADEQAINTTHAATIGALVLRVAAGERTMARTRATAIIRYRMPDCRDWSNDDTATLPTPLVAALTGFFQQEETGAREPIDAEKALQQLEEDLGKLRPKPMHDSGLTGRQSSGSADVSIQVQQSSPAIVLHGSQRPTSSKRSRKG